MLPDRVSNPGPLTYESGALPIALRGPALTELLIDLLKYQHPLFFSLSAHLGQEDMARYLVPYCRVDAYNVVFSPSDIRLWKSLPTETVSVQSLESFKILIMDWCLKHGCFNQF